MTTGQVSYEEALSNLREALRAIRLEVPAEIADDLKEKVEAYIAAAQRRLDAEDRVART